jgi:hypothetical protein
MTSESRRSSVPSIEIVCIGQFEISQFDNLPFLVEAENRLVSHRKPHPLFQKKLDALQGCIYHLLNPTESWDAYLLLDTSIELMKRAPEPDEDSLIQALRFRPEYAPAVHAFLKTLLEASPVGQVMFTSDYQFGPEGRLYTNPFTLNEFWSLHDADRLHLNALYPLHR